MLARIKQIMHLWAKELEDVNSIVSAKISKFNFNK